MEREHEWWEGAEREGVVVCPLSREPDGDLS